MDVDDLEQNLLSAFSGLNTNDKDDLVVRFQNLIGQAISRPTCEFFLDMSNWNLQQAVCSYYDLEANSENLPQMSFVQDVTIGEGESVPPKTKFVKTWKIQNPGWETWPPGCVLKFTGNGAQMTHVDRISLPSLKSSETFDASIEMESPEMPGIYQGQWRMCTPTGVYCGETIWVILQVDSNGLLSLTQQMSSLPLGMGDMNMSKPAAFGSTKNPFASSSPAAFPGNNSPNDDNGNGMDEAW
ncbi:hypothetical protein RvY_00169 [Ramazzottius varieornatus]|uniref:Nbr1 FW domain-containing protein n=1 Tax=Ramazzottius varieornatus TaxID=947166 RepID=A0A1D1UFI2_RAMVA|nr:hypothetical protein RvY_00169 [Ramazzottius varieornatus]